MERLAGDDAAHDRRAVLLRCSGRRSPDRSPASARARSFDRVGNFVAMAGVSFPYFWFGQILILVVRRASSGGCRRAARRRREQLHAPGRHARHPPRRPAVPARALGHRRRAGQALRHRRHGQGARLPRGRHCGTSCATSALVLVTMVGWEYARMWGGTVFLDRVHLRLARHRQARDRGRRAATTSTWCRPVSSSPACSWCSPTCVVDILATARRPPSGGRLMSANVIDRRRSGPAGVTAAAVAKRARSRLDRSGWWCSAFIGLCAVCSAVVVAPFDHTQQAPRGAFSRRSSTSDTRPAPLRHRRAGPRRAVQGHRRRPAHRCSSA